MNFGSPSNRQGYLTQDVDSSANREWTDPTSSVRKLYFHFDRHDGEWDDLDGEPWDETEDLNALDGQPWNENEEALNEWDDQPWDNEAPTWDDNLQALYEETLGEEGDADDSVWNADAANPQHCNSHQFWV